MKLPALADVPGSVPLRDLQRSLEAMLAGLYCEPPDAFADDWEETMEEVERLLDEVERGCLDSG